MSSPGGSTAQAYIIYASVSLTGRPLVSKFCSEDQHLLFPERYDKRTILTSQSH